MSKNTFTVTIEKVEKETYEVDLQADSAIAALDEARAMANLRNKKSKAQFSVIKVVQKEEENVQ